MGKCAFKVRLGGGKSGLKGSAQSTVHKENPVWGNPLDQQPLLPWFIDPCKGRMFTGAQNKKEGAKASFLAGFIPRVCGLGETDYLWKGWGVGAPIFTFCRRAPVFACAERVTGPSWSLLISHQQQTLLVHGILHPKPGCNHGQSQILPSY